MTKDLSSSKITQESFISRLHPLLTTDQLLKLIQNLYMDREEITSTIHLVETMHNLEIQMEIITGAFITKEFQEEL